MPYESTALMKGSRLSFSHSPRQGRSSSFLPFHVVTTMRRTLAHSKVRKLKNLDVSEEGGLTYFANRNSEASFAEERKTMAPGKNIVPESPLQVLQASDTLKRTTTNMWFPLTREKLGFSASHMWGEQTVPHNSTPYCERDKLISLADCCRDQKASYPSIHTSASVCCANALSVCPNFGS